jgi:hypothetical protein
MAGFLTLPNELLGGVLSHLPSVDLLNTALTNHLLHNLAQPYLKLRWQYQAIYLNSSDPVTHATEELSKVQGLPKEQLASMVKEDTRVRSMRPVEFLQEVVQYPEIAKYVMKLSVGPMRSELDSDYFEFFSPAKRKRERKRLQEDMEILKNNNNFKDVLQGMKLPMNIH